MSVEHADRPDAVVPPRRPAGATPPRHPRRHRLAHRVLHPLPGLTLPGAWGAVLFAAVSFTPSLLPRSGTVQGVVCGISAAIGYGLGVAAAGGGLLVVFFALGQWWQSRLRELVGVTDVSVTAVVLSPVVAAVVFVLLVLLGRGVRGVYRWAARRLARVAGPRAARATGWLATAALVYVVVTGVLFHGFVALANETFSLRNDITPAGVHRPTTSLRSGGPGSLVPWDSLGREGRKFTGTGPTATQISAWSGAPAQEPVRAYAGLESAGDTRARADLAVRDLERAGGFGRRNLLVVSTTGSGWVDPSDVDTFEYLTGGDAATVAIQYSYLPSWISYLVDRTKAREAGRDLFDAVYARWSTLPPGSRPRLYVAGESLGSYGAESAFSGDQDLANRTAGALLVGPPNFNTLYREFVDNRQPGTREVEPVYRDGSTVRFTQDPAAGIPPAGRPWPGTRVLYVAHASDPIVWWDWSLALHRPDWVSEEPGTDALRGTVWIPFVTFWQVTADLPFATGVPAGHGHRYTSEYVDAWLAVMHPAGVGAERANALKALIAAAP